MLAFFALRYNRELIVMLVKRAFDMHIHSLQIPGYLLVLLILKTVYVSVKTWSRRKSSNVKVALLTSVCKSPVAENTRVDAREQTNVLSYCVAHVSRFI